MRKDSVVFLSEPAADHPHCMSWSGFLASHDKVLATARCLVLSGSFYLQSPYYMTPFGLPVNTRPRLQVQGEGDKGDGDKDDLIVPLRMDALWEWASAPRHSLILLLPVLYDPAPGAYLGEEEAAALQKAAGGAQVRTVFKTSDDPGLSSARPARTPLQWPQQAAAIMSGDLFCLPEDRAHTMGLAVGGMVESCGLRPERKAAYPLG